MKKKLISFILILAMFVCIFHFAACSKIGSLPSSETPSGSISSGNEQAGTNSHIHSYTESVVAPTCIEQGYTRYVCICGDSYEDKFVAPLGHNFVNYTADGNASCTIDGTKTAICERCKVKDTVADINSATGHSYSEVLSYNETSHWYSANCIHSEEKKDLGAHIMGQWVFVKEPTRYEEGQKSANACCAIIVRI